MLTLRSNGVQVGFGNHVAELKTTFRWPGGFHEAAWKMDTAYAVRPRHLEQGAFVEVMHGTALVGTGRLETSDWAAGDFLVTGHYREAERYAAFDGAGNTSSVPDVALDAAIARGLPFRRAGSFSAVPFTATAATDNVNTLESLLTGVASAAGVNWWLDADRYIHLTADPTKAAWHLTPGSVELGEDSEEYASDVVVRFKNLAGNFQSATASVSQATEDRYGHSEHLVDLTDRGRVDPSVAQAVANNILAGAGSSPGFTDSVEASSFELLTPGGEPAALNLVRAGQYVYAHGLGIGFVIAESSYVDGSGVVTLTPKGKVASTLSELTEQQVNSVAAAFQA